MLQEGPRGPGAVGAAVNNRPMHLLIPFASALSEAGVDTLRHLELPNLVRLLPLLAEGPRLGVDEASLTPPHERALAEALGWRAEDGCLPWAARLAAADGVAVGDAAWGLLTPTHWSAGRDQITLADPSALALGDDESRAFLEAVRELFESEGFIIAWGAATRWYASHAQFDGLPCASLDRVIGRDVDPWLPVHAQGRLVRRLQNEVQMLLHEHPLNEARESRGRLPVNSVWISGTGPTQPLRDPRPQVDDRLVAPALVGDWPAWADAWAQLDAELAAQPWTVLTLCGERGAITWRREAAAPWWKAAMARLRGVDVAAALEGL